MLINPIFAVFFGAGVGALLRWWLSIHLNPLFPTIPLGTLASNLIGGLLVGLFTAFFTHHAGLAPEYRLLLITGFLGGLTTFSTFSAEVVNLIVRSEYMWALAAAGMHLFGSLLMTLFGIAITQYLFAKI